MRVSVAETESERAFEQYLDGQKVKWERLPETGRPQPDYAVRHAGARCAFEVKEFDDPKGERAQQLKRVGGGFDPCPPVREKIHQGRKKLGAYTNHACGVVLWSSKSIFRPLYPEVVMASAFGQHFRTEPHMIGDLGAEPPRYAFSGPAELRADTNTTVSAIVILTRYQLDLVLLEGWRRLSAKTLRGEAAQPGDQWTLTQQAADELVGPRYLYQGTLRTIVIENPYARMPFPPGLFVGPFDQRWRMSDSGFFGLAFMGSELERLKHEGVPFIYL